MYNFEKIYEATHLLEKKDHLIKKIPELSEDEKSQVIDWFAKHPNRENEINWNNIKDLKYSDFEVLMKTESKTGRKNKVKLNGLQGLLEGTDFGLAYEDENIIGIVPFHYEASKLIASKYVGKVEAKWCTAFQKTDKYWKDYTQQGITFIYFINKVETESWNKIALAIYPTGQLEIFDEKDDDYKEEWLYGIIEESIIETSIEEAKLLGKKINRDFSVDLTLEMLKERDIDFHIDSDGFVHVDGDCDISYMRLRSFGKINFGTIGGYFSCSGNVLTSLSGGPRLTERQFDCSNNKLTSLAYCPRSVQGGFYCSDNLLTSLEHCPSPAENFDCSRNNITSLVGSPKRIGRDFRCNSNPITSLEGCPQEVEGDFDCTKTQIINLIGSPKKVMGFDCSYSKFLTSLEGSPETVPENFNCSNTSLTSLIGSPIQVGGSYKCFSNKLISLEGCPQGVGYDFSCNNNKLTSLEGCPIKVGGSFYCYDNEKTFTRDYVKSLSIVEGTITC